MQRGQKSFNGFKSGTLVGRFPSDGATSMAVKGLIFLAGKLGRFAYGYSSCKGSAVIPIVFLPAMFGMRTAVEACDCTQ